MAVGMIDTQNLTDIADAIREKSGSSETFKPSEMAEAIENIPTGTEPTGTVNITTNGTVDVTEYASANVAVHDVEDAFITNAPMDEYYNERVTTIGITNQNDVFGATRIKKISFPNVTTCPASYAFHGRNISLLEELYMPKLQTSGYGFAENNPNVRVIDFGFSFGGAKCRNCPNLEVLIIRDTSIKAVGESWITGCTKVLASGSGCYVYVPQALLSQYQSNSAWATYAHVLEFRAIEGSIYE